MPDLQRRERFLQAFGHQAALALDAAGHERGEIDRRIAAVKQAFHDSARRVVHEVNNPLAIIKNYLGVLDDKLGRQQPVQGELSLLHEEIDRVSTIMNEFAGTAPVARPDKVEINRVVNNVVRLFRDSKFLPLGVEIVAQELDEPCEIEGSADTLKQILVNLVKNAVEAMPKGGTIEIINGPRSLREGRSFFELRVKDTGPGIPPEQHSRLFSPLQSTKAGSNRGIGLSIVQGLVKKLGGTIACVSSPRGTTFEILLPVSGTRPSTSAAPLAQ
jgi:signal transduction histidine kinase